MQHLSLTGVSSNTFQIGKSGCKWQVITGGLKLTDIDGTTLSKFTAAGADSTDIYHLASWLNTMSTVARIDFGFNGATPPSAGANTGKFGICHTTGGSYTTGEIVYDDGSSLLLQPIGRHIIIPSVGVSGTISLTANHVYHNQSESAPYNWTETELTQNKILNLIFPTVSAAEAATFQADEFCSISETGKTYQFFQDASDTIDHFTILGTAGGGRLIETHYELDRCFIDVTEDTALRRFSVAEDVTAGVWTVTITQIDGQNLLFNIDRTRLEHTSSSMTVDCTSYAGTDAVPKTVYVYVQKNGSAPQLVATNTPPEGSVHHIDCIIYHAGAVSTSTRTNYGAMSVALSTYELFTKVYHKEMEAGPIWESGLGHSGTSSALTIAAGTVKLIFDIVSTASVTSSSGFYHITPFGSWEYKTDFSFTTYGDGGSINSSKYYSVVFGVMLDAGTTKLFAIVQNEPSSEYTTAQAAFNDAELKRRTTTSNSFLNQIFMPVCFVVIQNTASDLLISIGGSYTHSITTGGVGSAPTPPGGTTGDFQYNDGTGFAAAPLSYTGGSMVASADVNLNAHASAGASYYSTSGTVPSTGLFRVPLNTEILNTRNSSNTGDFSILKTDSNGNLTIGVEAQTNKTIYFYGYQISMLNCSYLNCVNRPIIYASYITQGGSGYAANSGFLRIANNQALAWRNAADTNNIYLSINSNDALNLDSTNLTITDDTLNIKKSRRLTSFTKSANYTIVDGDPSVLYCDPADGNLVITLLSSAPADDIRRITNMSATYSVAVAGNGANINGSSSNLTVTPLQTLVLHYNSSTGWWC